MQTDPPHIQQAIAELRATHATAMSEFQTKYDDMKKSGARYMDFRHPPELQTRKEDPNLAFFLKQLQQKEDVFIICQKLDYNTDPDEFSMPYTRVWISPKKDGFIREHLHTTLEFVKGK